MERAALEYIEGFYEGDSTKLQGTLRRDLWKYGFFHGTNTFKCRTDATFSDRMRRLKPTRQGALLVLGFSPCDCSLDAVGGGAQARQARRVGRALVVRDVAAQHHRRAGCGARQRGRFLVA